jgi:hypothetical protein
MKSKMKLLIVSATALACCGLAACQRGSASSSAPASSVAVSSVPASSSVVTKYSVSAGYIEAAKAYVEFDKASAAAGETVVATIFIRDAVNNMVTDVQVNDTKVAFIVDSKLPNRATASFTMPAANASVDVYVGKVTEKLTTTISDYDTTNKTYIESEDSATLKYWAGEDFGVDDNGKPTTPSQYPEAPYFISGMTVYVEVDPAHDRVVDKVTYGGATISPDDLGWYAILLSPASGSKINVYTSTAYEIATNEDDQSYVLDASGKATDEIKSDTNVFFKGIPEKNVAAGATVSFSVSIRSGFKFDTVVGTYLDGTTTKDLTLTSTNGTYSFKMPKGDVTLAATALPVNPPTGVAVAWKDELAVANKLEIGDAETLTPTYTPADANQGLIWTSSDPTIATVSKSGVVTGVAAGSVTITATSKYADTVTTTYAIDVIKGVEASNLLAKETADTSVTLTGAKVLANDATNGYLIVATADGTALVSTAPATKGSPTAVETAAAAAVVGKYYDITGTVIKENDTSYYVLEMETLTAFAENATASVDTTFIDRSATVDFTKGTEPTALASALHSAADLAPYVGTRMTFKNIWFNTKYLTSNQVVLLGDQTGYGAWLNGGANNAILQFQLSGDQLPAGFNTATDGVAATRVHYNIDLFIDYVGFNDADMYPTITITSATKLS